MAFRHETGDVLGSKYRLERRIGAGGMGEVWLAINVALDLPVAIKLLHEEVRGPRSEQMASHLMREARAAASMSHPAVVRVYDLGRTYRGDPYIVMERLEGEDLREKLFREGPMRPRQAVRLLLPVMDAIQTAHLRGIVHRDLKPENVFLTRDDAGRTFPKVVDFGIAELRWLETVDALAGTPDYMAPEQLRPGAIADHRVDTWALAVMLHEMISGRPPFEAPSMRETFRRIESGAPDDLPADCDGRLRAIIMAALSRRPDERPRSAREFGESLARWLMSRGVSDDVAGQSLASTWFGETEMAPTCDAIEALILPERADSDAQRGIDGRRASPSSGTRWKRPPAPFQVPRQATRPALGDWPPRADQKWAGLTIGLVAVAAAALTAVAIRTSVAEPQGDQGPLHRIEASLSNLF